MRCGFCGLEFDPADSEPVCSGCPLRAGCGKVRCPRCGYEMPPPARLLTWLEQVQQWFKSKWEIHISSKRAA
jgi:hypothetical protein